MVASDHRPVVAYLEDKVVRRKGQFRFDKRWIGQEGLMESITMGWSDYSGGREDGIVEKIGIVVTKLLNGGKIIHLMERKK